MIGQERVAVDRGAAPGEIEHIVGDAVPGGVDDLDSDHAGRVRHRAPP
ncbi:MAG: hypothetical protein WKF58_19790 [Ilumatobacteraceae bacterium]